MDLANVAIQAFVALALAGCGCGRDFELETMGSIVAVRVQLPDNGDKPSLGLHVDATDLPSGCPWAIYEFTSDPAFSSDDLVAVNAGVPKDESTFEGLLLAAGVVEDTTLDELVQLTNAKKDRNPYEGVVAIVLCGTTNNAHRVYFLAEALCVQGEDNWLKAGPTLEEVVVEINP